VTVDWFHVVQLFTKAVDDVRKAERRLVRMPAATRWAVLKAHDGGRLTGKQAAALAELETGDFLTAKAWRIKEKLRWVRRAETPNAARWRLSHFLRHAHQQIGHGPLLDAVAKALETVEKHRERILHASCSDGPRPTATPAWKPSTACSKRPEPGPGATETPLPSSP
jgi:transposase